MKTLCTFLVSVIGLTACQRAALPSVPSNSQDITGVWQFIGEPGKPASPDKKIKFIVDRHWMYSHFDPRTNLTLYQHGGTYVAEGVRYTETIEYANQRSAGLIGQTFRYEVSIQGDTLFLKGLGNPYNEVWKRAK